MSCVRRSAVLIIGLLVGFALSVSLAGAQSSVGGNFSKALTERSFPAGALVPAGPIDASTANTRFTVNAGDFPADAQVVDVELELQFSKVGDGTCPGPGGGRDWAEEIRFRLYSPGGILVALVRYNDYNSSNPDVGPVTVVFDDDAATSVAGRPVQSGSFRPSNGALADFNGLDPAADGGQWRLELADQWLDDPLCFINATLTISTGGPFDAGVQISDSPDPLRAGDLLSYEALVSADVDDPMSNVALTLSLPDAFAYLDDSGGCSYSAGAGPAGEDQLSCSRTELLAGAVWPVQVIGRVPADAVAGDSDGSTLLSCVAELSADQSEIIAGNNTSTATTMVFDEADLAVTKLTQPGNVVAAGEPFSYTILVDNLGPSSARNVVLQDDILLSGDFSLNGVTEDPARNDSCEVQGSSVRCELAEPLEPVGFGPGSGRWTVVIEVVASTAQTVSNLVTVLSEDPDGTAGPAAATPDPVTTNNQATSFVDVTAVADLEAELTLAGEVQRDGEPGGAFSTEVDAVTAGGELTHTFVVRNLGPSPASNVVAQLELPPGLQAPALSASQGSCTMAPSSPMCAVGVVAAGGVVTVTATARVAEDVAHGAELSASALVSSDLTDPDNTNDLSSGTALVNRWADLAVSIDAAPEPCPPGETLTVTALVTNQGPSAASGATASFTLGSGEVFLGSTQCAANGATVSCELPALHVGASGAVAYHSVVDAEAPPTVDHLVTVAGVETDPWPDDNADATSTVTDVVHPQVLWVDTVPATSGAVLDACETTSVAPAAFAVAFDEAVFDPPGDVDQDDVSNPANYRLLAPGANLAFETAGCEAAAGDDEQVVPTGVSYDEGTRVASITLANPLPASQYRLVICGSPGIEDTVGNPLDGDGDGSGGDDHVLPFRVDPGNLFANGHLDCDLGAWQVISTHPDEIAFAELDRWSSPDSGSVLVSNLTASETFSMQQCLETPGVVALAMSGALQLAAEPGVELELALHCDWFDTSDCTAPIGTSARQPFSVVDSAGQWVAKDGVLYGSESAQSVSCGVTLQTNQDDFQAHLDELVLQDISASCLFANGFEDGDLQRWSWQVP